MPTSTSRPRKPLALHAIWNQDLSISIFLSVGGKRIHHAKGLYSKEHAEAFFTGWFGDHPKRVRWTFKVAKKAA